MPIVRFVRGPAVALPDPPVVPDPPVTSALDVLSLEVAKRQLRITTNDADAIVLDAVEGAVAFVADAANVTYAELADSRTLVQAVIVVLRDFYNGYSEIPPLHAVWALINAGACR